MRARDVDPHRFGLHLELRIKIVGRSFVLAFLGRELAVYGREFFFHLERDVIPCGSVLIVVDDFVPVVACACSKIGRFVIGQGQGSLGFLVVLLEFQEFSGLFIITDQCVQGCSVFRRFRFFFGSFFILVSILVIDDGPLYAGILDANLVGAREFAQGLQELFAGFLEFLFGRQVVRGHIGASGGVGCNAFFPGFRGRHFFGQVFERAECMTTSAATDPAARLLQYFRGYAKCSATFGAFGKHALTLNFGA